MLSEDVKIKWEEFFKTQGNELGLNGKELDAFVSAAMFGVSKYSLALTRALVSYGESLCNTDQDGDNWMTDGTVRLYIQNVDPSNKL